MVEASGRLVDLDLARCDAALDRHARGRGDGDGHEAVAGDAEDAVEGLAVGGLPLRPLGRVAQLFLVGGYAEDLLLAERRDDVDEALRRLEALGWHWGAGSMAGEGAEALG